jgi:hypothetical protein
VGVKLEDVKRIIIALLRSADYCSIAFSEDDVTLCFRTEDEGVVYVGLNLHGLHKDAEIGKEIEDCVTRWRRQGRQIK